MRRSRWAAIRKRTTRGYTANPIEWTRRQQAAANTRRRLNTNTLVHPDRRNLTTLRDGKLYTPPVPAGVGHFAFTGNESVTRGSEPTAWKALRPTATYYVHTSAPVRLQGSDLVATRPFVGYIDIEAATWCRTNTHENSNIHMRAMFKVTGVTPGESRTTAQADRETSDSRTTGQVRMFMTSHAYEIPAGSTITVGIKAWDANNREHDYEHHAHVRVNVLKYL